MIAVLMGLMAGWCRQPCYLCLWVQTQNTDQYPIKRKKIEKRKDENHQIGE